MTTVYKVLSIVDGKLFSAFAPPNISVTYEKDKESKPKVGLLFAFSSLESAKKLRFGVGQTIWKAEAKIDESKTAELISKNICKSMFTLESLKTVNAFWKRGELPLNLHPTLYGPIPEGTVLCKSITLKEKVG